MIKLNVQFRVPWKIWCREAGVFIVCFILDYVLFGTIFLLFFLKLFLLFSAVNTFPVLRSLTWLSFGCVRLGARIWRHVWWQLTIATMMELFRVFWVLWRKCVFHDGAIESASRLPYHSTRCFSSTPLSDFAAVVVVVVFKTSSWAIHSYLSTLIRVSCLLCGEGVLFNRNYYFDVNRRAQGEGWMNSNAR